MFKKIFLTFIIFASVNLHAIFYVGVSSIQGRKKYMEDRHAIDYCGKYSLFSVIDGHGGKQPAEFAFENLHQNILNNENFFFDVSRAIKKGFAETDKQLKESFKDLEYPSYSMIDLMRNNFCNFQ